MALKATTRFQYNVNMTLTKHLKKNKLKLNFKDTGKQMELHTSHEMVIS